MYFNFFKEQTFCVLVISTIPTPQSHITCLLSLCLRGISSGKAYETDLLPKAGGSRRLSSGNFLMHCTLDHCLFFETLLTWRFQNRTLLVAVVVLLFLLFLFLHHFFFLAVSSQLSSGAPLFPLPKEGSTASIWTLQFFLVYKKFFYLYFICHLYLDDFKFPAQTSSPGLRLSFPSLDLFGASLRAQVVKRLPAMQETGV